MQMKRDTSVFQCQVQHAKNLQAVTLPSQQGKGEVTALQRRAQAQPQRSPGRGQCCSRPELRTGGADSGRSRVQETPGARALPRVSPGAPLHSQGGDQRPPPTPLAGEGKPLL